MKILSIMQRPVNPFKNQFQILVDKICFPDRKKLAIPKTSFILHVKHTIQFATHFSCTVKIIMSIS